MTFRAGVTDGRAARLLGRLRRGLGLPLEDLTLVDVYLVDGCALTRAQVEETFTDPVAEEGLIDEPLAGRHARWQCLIEVTPRPGVTDTVALTAREAMETVLGHPLPAGTVVQTARQYLFGGSFDAAGAAALAAALHNPLIQSALALDRARWERGERPPALYPHVVPASPAWVERFDVAAMGDEELAALSRRRLLALTTEEMRAIRGYVASGRGERTAAGIGAEATDVELEMIAQTWSEHCKHKIFAASIAYREGDRVEHVDSLFRTYIRSTTERIAKPFLKSVFHDNSGVIQVDEETLLAFKVETHNSPSALDPYGGAITGIVGVNRDILGTGMGARPIFNTNVLCFADPATPADRVPAALLPPARVLEGVHHGIVDGGNQSGIPVVAGAFLFDESYLGKPLVFCGTGGILPARLNGEEGWVKHVEPGDLAVMVGGRIGKDGIHGATFSSLALDETSPTSAVQIGDPIIQKRMTDLLMEARDRGLYRGLTDNGAGGLSSSLGEMAMEPGGVRIELDKCPLKYAGLAPWEILLSESQERMSLAVAPEKAGELLALARRRGVEATVVGAVHGLRAGRSLPRRPPRSAPFVRLSRRGSAPDAPRGGLGPAASRRSGPLGPRPPRGPARPPRGPERREQRGPGAPVRSRGPGPLGDQALLRRARGRPVRRRGAAARARRPPGHHGHARDLPALRRPRHAADGDVRGRRGPARARGAAAATRIRQRRSTTSAGRTRSLRRPTRTGRTSSRSSSARAAGSPRRAWRTAFR